MSADDLFSEGNDAFVDDDYNLAVEKYTGAIELNSHHPKYYTQRAAAFIKLGKYQDGNPSSRIKQQRLLDKSEEFFRRFREIFEILQE